MVIDVRRGLAGADETMTDNGKEELVIKYIQTGGGYVNGTADDFWSGSYPDKLGFITRNRQTDGNMA